MNNDYDRDPIEETIEETLEVVLTEPERSVGLFLLTTGESVISEYTISMVGDEYTFIDPRSVMIESSGGDGSSTTTTVAYADWMPLSQDRIFSVSNRQIITISRPLDSLVESYLGAKNG